MRILVVRLSALGDIVHALPVLAAIRRARPDAIVDWLVEEAYAPILGLADGLHRRIVVRGTQPGTMTALQAVRFLRRQRYDAALDLQGLIKSAVWARASGAARVIGFARDHLREPQAAWLYSETVVPDAARHVIRKNLSMLPALGIDGSVVELPLSPEASDVVRAAIAAAGGPRRYAVLNPGAAWPNKRWPPERFGALAARLRDTRGLPSLVCWGPAERALAETVVAAASGAAVAAPPTSVSDLAVLLGSAALVVSGDTGPLHIAAAMGAPLVGLYGPTWPERNGPWNPADQVISRADSCVCHHKRRCLRGAPCIDEITVDEVVAASERRLLAR